jgi:protein TonB
MNRELSLCFLGALMIHGSVLWAWAQAPTPVIGARETPAVEIEISEEQTQASSTESAKAEMANEMPPITQEKKAQLLPESEAMVPEPQSMPAPQPTPQARLQTNHAPQRPVTTNPRSVPPSAASTHLAVGGKDRAHASWKHRVTPSYPPSALMARSSGRVLVTVQVNALGQATAASVSSSSGNPVLDSAAARAARASTYNPRCVLGVPLPDTVVIPYNFGIRGR